MSGHTQSTLFFSAPKLANKHLDMNFGTFIFKVKQKKKAMLVFFLIQT